MYRTMLKQELFGRKRQTIIVAAGLAIAIALVIIVSALSTGVKDAQAKTLENMYGVGTDLTVTAPPQAPGSGRGGPRFEFEASDGTTNEGTTKIDQSVLTSQRGRGTLEASVLDTVSEIDGVASVTGVLSLENTTFTGEMPDFSEMQQQGTMPSGPDGMPGGMPSESNRGPGGPDGEGGSEFGIENFTVLGVDPTEMAVGPLSGANLTEGRQFSNADSDGLVALVDQTYATTNELAVNDIVEVAGSEVTIVGIIASGTDSADTAANLYLPIDSARSLADMDNVVSTVYVSADSAASTESIQAALQAALPDATVNSKADLAEQVSGSLSNAASLITNLGTWLSVIVLVVALLIAALLTSSGVSRRTREFGTLKAIGWSNSRVVGQVAGESLIQALIGGVAGLALGLGLVGIINWISPTISTNVGNPPTGFGGSQPPEGGFPMGDMPGRMGQEVASSADIVLGAPVTPWIVLGAIGLAVFGGLLAGVVGGWRAARLSPVEALRFVG